jgi:transposase InsO family protein
VWAADITYLATFAGPTYLAVVIDPHARPVVGWARPDLVPAGHRDHQVGWARHRDPGFALKILTKPDLRGSRHPTGISEAESLALPRYRLPFPSRLRRGQGLNW